MKKLYTLIVILFFSVSVMQGQSTLTISVADSETSLPIEGASVQSSSFSGQTDASGQLVLNNIADGTYSYTVTADCFIAGSNSVTVAGSDVGSNTALDPETTNNVFFFVGSPFTLSGATVNLTGPNGYNESIVTGAILGDLFENVPYGEYNYTITLDCYETLTGSVTVECIGGGQGVSVFASPVEETTNNVFFFVGSPFTLSGATVNLTGPNGYNESIVTGAILGDLFENVPYGEYNYTITLDCYETLTGSVTVECIGGGQGVSVFASPVEETTNNVFFFVGSPFTLSGATVNLTGPNGYNESIVTGAILGDLFENVPYGEYNYTITLDCYETLTGSVTVECIGGGQGVSVFASPVEETTNNVFFFVGSPFTLSGATVNLTGPNGYNESIVTGAILGDLFENVPYGEYNYTITLDCYETLTGSVTVECIGGGQGVSVFASPVEETTNNVFFFVGSPFTLSGATVNLTGPNGYNESIVTGAILGDLFENVPYGEYNYTITLDCYETLTGSVTVECIGGGQGVSVFASPVEETTNNVFFFVGSPFTLSGATVNLTGPNGYNESIVTGAILGDLFENVPYGEYNYTITLDCYETLTGSVTVECIGGGQGVSVFASPVEETTNNVFFFVGSPFTLSGATVNLTGPNGYNESIVTGAILGDLFENVPYGEYNYTITLDCYETLTGSVTVECIGGGQGVSVFASPVEETTNNVFFFVGSPFTLSGATVNLTGPNGYNESIVTGAILGDLFENVPYGEYNYTITLDCYETLTGSVTVECIGGGQGVSVFASPVEETTNNVFFFVGSPFTLSGATVNLTGPNGYNESIVTGAILGDLFENVPYGEYNYTITLDCYETLTGSVTVECIGGGQGVSVFASPVEETTNNVFFFVGSPFTLSGATVNLTGPNGYNESIVTGAILGDLFENVPYGEYNYTITLDCYETLTGSVTVECIGGGQGVSVFASPVEIVLDTEVTLEGGNTLTASATGVSYQWIDCVTEEPIEGATDQVFVAIEAGEYAVIITQDNCSATSECIIACEDCPTVPLCELPYPGVDPGSLTAAVLPNGKIRFEWEPILGQIGCQINILIGSGPQQASVIRPGANASSFEAPANQLVPFTTYNYRVRCGCSQNPLVAGAFTPYAAVFYLPPTITGEMGTAYADTPLPQVNSDIQWTNTNLDANVIGDLFAMASDESWVRVAPNPAQDNVNLSYNSIMEGQGLIRVFDAQGKLALERVMTFNKGLNNVNLNLNELENGMYIVEVLKGDSRESVRLLMQ